MPKASIIVPAYNAANTIQGTLDSLLAQTFEDFEIIIVDDGSTDATQIVARSYCEDPRVVVVRQSNRGLAGARNTGIDAAQGEYVGFCDADDLWAPSKLAVHVAHLELSPDVGVSYSGSRLIDKNGFALGTSQSPVLTGITAACVFKRNPIGNGSAPVIRRSALQDLAYRPAFESRRDWVFDETFRQSEDIECWLRFALTTDWQIEGVPGFLTVYRINGAGLSARTGDQLAAWERMVEKLRPLHPEFFELTAAAARAYQLRYLSRRAVSALDGETAWALMNQSLRSSRTPLIEEPCKTTVTACAAAMLKAFGPAPLKYAAQVIQSFQSVKA